MITQETPQETPKEKSLREQVVGWFMNLPHAIWSNVLENLRSDAEPVSYRNAQVDSMDVAPLLFNEFDDDDLVKINQTKKKK